MTNEQQVMIVGIMCIGIIGVLMVSLPCKADEKGDFVKPPLKFRSRPFWFWNNTEVTAAGVEEQMVGCRDLCGEPGIAVDALLKDSARNQFDQRGVNTGGPCPYLPGNGGLLYAVAMMAAGWDGAPARHAPGFPADGSRVVKWEGLKTAP